MSAHVSIGVIGDFNPDYHTHPAIAHALQHSGAKQSVRVDVEWVPTPLLHEPGSEKMLQRFDGLIAAPGGPYRSFDGMLLRGIEFARTRNWPFSGT
jgi:CTP synthase (UTP-ammonia lyase)